MDVAVKVADTCFSSLNECGLQGHIQIRGNGSQETEDGGKAPLRMTATNKFHRRRDCS